MLERTVGCPACQRPVRLTEAELVDKRGFCAACDARFELLPEMFIGEGQHQELAMTPAVESAPPTTRRVQVLAAEPAGPFRVRLTSRNYLMLVPFSTFGIATFFQLKGLQGFANLFLDMSFLFSLLFARGRAMLGREEISIDANHLVLRQRVLGFYRTHKIPLAAIEGFSMATEHLQQGLHGVETSVLKLLRSGDEPLRIGSRLQLDQDAMRWLCQKLERDVREARLRGNQAGAG